MEETECPVCLEQLTGTLVELGCCHKKVHIQCYVTKCPMCRADLPLPIHAQQVQHVIVPIPVWPQPQPAQWKKFGLNCVFMATLVGGLFWGLGAQYF
ncbi:hypothetical protein [Yellowstone lake phycodnavirus 3]|jgi:hypothetical protein|uniref:hypothetical protein n=1 Tax=Yellowstone lake phycodnavirus 3 TaxID=1586715 RepID=UPI0006EB2C31|nr:hypothetical protein AR677_gp213 [Yellowstone lake phycodnavirus 3]BAT22712.1 hypothetical protein [Yellowstone lake phycodnavirus 3]